MGRKEEITKFVKEGKTLKEIGEILGITRPSVRYWLEKLGLKTASSRTDLGIRPPKHDLLGKVFGNLTVLEVLQINEKGIWGCICKCACGKITKPISNSALLRGTNKSCGCRLGLYEYRLGEKAPNWTGCGELPGVIWARILRWARLRGQEVTVTIQDCWDLFLKQDKKCALSGVDLCFGSRGKRVGREATASLDRIDSTGDYTINNIQWVHKRINKMKMELGQAEFLYFCKKIAEHQKDLESK